MNDFVASERTIRDLLGAATAELIDISDSPRLDAELLLARALDMPRSYLVAHPEDRPDLAAQERYADSMAARKRGVPIAYIEGNKEFWSLNLMVSRATLVPRPETELLVEKALALIPRDAAWRVLDLGTGSGAIALAIAQERPASTVVASDLSDAALAVAAENARQLDIDNVSFVSGCWTEPFAGQQFNLIASNPPYVRANDPALERLNHEPAMALASGADGLDAIRQLAAECAKLLIAPATLLLEHGSDQRDDVAAILASEGWSDISCSTDLAGLPRVTQARAVT